MRSALANDSENLQLEVSGVGQPPNSSNPPELGLEGSPFHHLFDGNLDL